ncbi:phosphatase [Pantoea sp. Aalb]|uniref:phosphatase n=1 Tax=Pantoea sp. Aalb TaxID=2576762 RepID=UPI0013275DDC|nr:phosphatase [Pantoea sp. Aalb]MXP67440.1 phosphatase [Pantoea sp. Aalb]
MYPIDLHVHTIASTHSYSTLHDYIIQAKKNGIKMFAITDHGPNMIDAPHYWHFINMRIWPRIIDGVGVLRGIEANIKNQQGEIDCNQSIIDELDLIIAGFHESVYVPTNKIHHTEAMIATIASGLVDIISHPGNPKFPIDILAIAEAAAYYNVALEINNSSFEYSRPGSEPNCYAIVEAVRNANGRLAFGSDSHIAFNIGKFEHCIRITNKLNFPESFILNFTPRCILDFLEQRKGKIINEFLDF